VARELNFLPASVRRRRTRRRKALLAATAAAAFLALAASGVLVPAALAARYRAEAAAVREHTAALTPHLALQQEVASLEGQYRELHERLSQIEAARRTVTPLLARLAGNLPPGVYLTSLEVRPGAQVRLAAVVHGPDQTVDLVLHLRNSGLFEHVEVLEIPLEREPRTITLALTLRTGVEAGREGRP
jgi:Tfp pilus assembly protein PilN